MNDLKTYWRPDSDTEFLSMYPISSAPACDPAAIAKFVLEDAPTPPSDDDVDTSDSSGAENPSDGGHIDDDDK